MLNGSKISKMADKALSGCKEDRSRIAVNERAQVNGDTVNAT